MHFDFGAVRQLFLAKVKETLESKADKEKWFGFDKKSVLVLLK